jgi:Domain of unknown function (DUF4328)
MTLTYQEARLEMDHPIVGALSPDGYFFWDGAQWVGAISSDGSWRWSGVAWVAIPQSPIQARRLAAYSSPRTLAVCVTVLIGGSVLVAAVEALLFRLYVAYTLTLGDLQVVYSVGVAGFLIFAISASLVILWFWRSHRNLGALGAEDLRFTTGWAIGWWLIPIACLWMPYRAAMEIWKASDPRAARTTSSDSRRQLGPSLLIRMWWAAWLASFVLSNLMAFVVPPDSNRLSLLTLVSGASTALAAILTILVVWSITHRQAERWRSFGR